MTFDKILRGVSEFNCRYADSYRTALEQLGSQPAPPLAVMLTCMDARILPHAITRTTPGELFMLRNAGNLVPPHDAVRNIYSDEAEAAAIEYLVMEMKIPHIIVCGHSGCVALRVAMEQSCPPEASNLRFWLRHAGPALDQLRNGPAFDSNLPELTRLAQINVIAQVKNLMSYPHVRGRVEAGRLNLHAWFFDLSKAEVQAWDDQQRRFLRIEGQFSREPADPGHAQEAEEAPPEREPAEGPPQFLHPRDQVTPSVRNKRTFRTGI